MAKSPKVIMHQCRFCDKKYKREETVMTHKCEKRDRYNERESRPMREAYRLYMMFMETHKLSIKKSEEPIIHFLKSKYFKDFYEFGQYLLNNDILEKEQFTKMIITSGKPVYEWCTHKTLYEWVKKCLLEEHPRRGVERSIPALTEWADLTGNEWNTFFENVSSERVIGWVESGKISPWLIWIAPPESTNKMFGRMSDSELEYIMKYLEPTHFQIKQITYQKDCDEIRSILRDAGI